MICRVVLLLAGLVALTTGLPGSFRSPAIRRGLPWRTGAPGSQLGLSQPSFRSMFQRGQLPTSGLRAPLRSSAPSLRTVPSGFGARRIGGGAVSIQRFGTRRSIGGIGQLRRPSFGGLTSLRQPIRSRRISPLTRGPTIGVRRGFSPSLRSRSDLLAMLRRSYGAGANNVQFRRSRTGAPIIRIPVRRNALATPVASRRIAPSASQRIAPVAPIAPITPVRSTSSHSISVVDEQHPSTSLDQVIAIFSMDGHNSTDSFGDLIPPLSETISRDTKVEAVTKTKSTETKIVPEQKETPEIGDKVPSVDKVRDPIVHATESKVVESAKVVESTKVVTEVKIPEAHVVTPEVVKGDVIIQDTAVKPDVIIPKTPIISDVIIPETPAKTDVIVDPLAPVVEVVPTVPTDVVAKDAVPVKEIIPAYDTVTSHPLDVIVDGTKIAKGPIVL